MIGGIICIGGMNIKGLIGMIPGGLVAAPSRELELEAK